MHIEVTRDGGVFQDGAELSFYQMAKIDGTTRLVHRLVAEAYIPNPENKPFVHHKNDDKSDNRVENLEWATEAENVQYAVRSGRLVPPRLHGEQIGTSKLMDADLPRIRDMIRSGARQVDIATWFMVSQETISSIKRGERWGSI